jgi:lipid A ethanolaminephosphotransferase
MKLLHKIFKQKKVFSRPISLFAFSCIISLGTLLLYNIPFFNYVAENSNESAGGKITRAG